jgi:hypothetical protein
MMAAHAPVEAWPIERASLPGERLQVDSEVSTEALAPLAEDGRPSGPPQKTLLREAVKDKHT